MTSTPHSQVVKAEDFDSSIEGSNPSGATISLFLVAHKVRGSATFDIAEQFQCTECHTNGCAECDDLGYWWITSTYGHRVYPFYYSKLSEDLMEILSYMPNDCLDHFHLINRSRSTKESSSSAKSFLTQLGFDLKHKTHPSISGEFKRRI